MKQAHKRKIGDLFDQLQTLIHEIESEGSYLMHYPDGTRGQTIQVVKVDMALCTALGQIQVASEFARQ